MHSPTAKPAVTKAGFGGGSDSKGGLADVPIVVSKLVCREQLTVPYPFVAPTHLNHTNSKPHSSRREKKL